MHTYIFDLDGTLANGEHRVHYISRSKKDWDMFYAEAYKDTPYMNIIELYNALTSTGATMWIWSGRSDSTVNETKEWLRKYGMRWDGLWMRDREDYRPDYVLKKEWLDALSDTERRQIVCAFEDRDQMVKMYRENGITCLQVKDGNY